MTIATQVNGRGRITRAIRELQQAVARVRPGFVPGALVSHTGRGTLVVPDGNTQNTTAGPRQSSSVPRWG